MAFSVRRGGWAALGLCIGLLGGACADPDAMSRPLTQEGETFGAKFFTVACQRVAYTSSLAAHAADPRLPIDVSGSRYRLACRYGAQFLAVDQTRSRDPKVAALFDYRQDFVDSIDLIFPGNELSDLQAYMVRILDLTDDGSFPAVVQKSAEAVDLARADPHMTQALARIEGRLGYRPRSVSLGILREALSYPKLQTLLDNTLELVAEGGKGHQAFGDLMAALSFELRNARRVDDASQDPPQHPAATDRAARLALDLLLTTDPAFASGSPRWLVARDWRGLARVRRTASGVAAPFVDKDSDGLADADVLGNFVTSTGKVPSPFHHDPKAPDAAVARDAYGRALDASGQPVFDYLNLDDTLLASFARDALKLLDPAKDTLLKALQGATAVLGPRRDQVRIAPDGKDSLSYRGFDSDKAPLLDLTHGVLSVLGDPAILQTLEGLKRLFTDHESELARVLGAARKASSLVDAYPARKIDPKSTVFDELLVLVRQLVNTPGLLEDVLTALKNPATHNLDRMLANYLKYADVHVLDTARDKVVSQSGGDNLFTRVVDRKKPDSGSNRSMQARLLHIIHDTNGMLMCNKEGAKISIPLICDLPLIKNTSLCTKTYKACELFQVDNGAVFYMMSIARIRDGAGKLTNTGKAYLRLKTENMPSLIAAAVDTIGADLILETMTGIKGMGEHPTTQALNRLMFMEQMPAMLAAAQDFPKDIDGEEIHKVHKGSLYSWEIQHPGMSCSANDPCVFYDAFRPVAQAFADHDQEKLLIDILSVLHRHWSSKQSSDYQYTNPKAPNFSHGSNVVSYEPALVDVLEKSDIMRSLSAVAGVIDGLKLGDNTPFKTVLTRTARFLVDPALSPGLAYRDGRTKALWSDGVTEALGGVSPIYLLADAISGIDDALDAATQETGDAWREATKEIIDLFLGTEAVAGQQGAVRFSNRRIIPAATVLLDFLRARVLAHSPACTSSSQCLSGGTCLGNGRCSTQHSGDDTAGWTKTLSADLERTLSGPLVASAADFVTVLREDPKAKSTLSDLLRHLIDEIDNGGQSFSATLTGLADLSQLLLDDDDLIPIVRVLGRALKPERGLVDTLLAFLKPAMARDQAGALTRILRNAVKEQLPGTSPAEVLLDMCKEMHRKKPGAKTPYDATDYQWALDEIRDFMGNQQTGLLKFFELIQNRCGGLCTKSKGN